MVEEIDYIFHKECVGASRKELPSVREELKELDAISQNVFLQGWQVKAPDAPVTFAYATLVKG